MRASVENENVVSIVTELLQCASRVLERDGQSARKEIQRALDLLLACQANNTGIQPRNTEYRAQGLALWQARRVIDHVAGNLETQIRVEELASVTRLSKSHFFRAFRLSFSTSPHAYILTLRLARAREMLMASDEQISRVAAACGFADQAHFSRIFRREIGCAPGLWRREQRRSSIADRASSAPGAAPRVARAC